MITELKPGERASVTLECALPCDETSYYAVLDAAYAYVAPIDGQTPDQKMLVEVAQLPGDDLEHPLLTFVGPVERVAALLVYHSGATRSNLDESREILDPEHRSEETS